MKKYLWWLLIVTAALGLAGCGQLGTLIGPSQKTVFVGPEKVDCEGEGPQTCYLVRENPDEQYGLYYDEIEGFDYEPGYEYELIVTETTVTDPPAGGSSQRWQVEEVVEKRPVTGITGEGPSGEAASDEATSEEATAEERASAIEFAPVVMGDLGISTIIPADWPKIVDDPLLPDAWGPSEYRFVAFHSVPGDSVEAAMAQLLSTTESELETGSIDGEYWQEEVGEYTWAMYALENPSLELVQTVSMTEQNGTIYVVSLFVKTAQKEAILTPVLKNFVIEGAGSAAEGGEEEMAPGSESAGATLFDREWILTAYEDASGSSATALAGANVMARFTEEGHVSGSAGCNEYVSLFTLEGANITISFPALTQEVCDDPAGIMELETAFLADLMTVSSYQVQGEVLQLLDEAGDSVLSFESP